MRSILSGWILLTLIVGFSPSSRAEPIFVPIKIDGPVHDPPNSYWYGPFVEVASVLDMNEDGKPDIVLGQDWYEAPDWKRHKQFRDGFVFFGKGVSFSAEVVMDVNRDGRLDLVTNEGRAGGMFWFENPGRVDATWPRRLVSRSSPLEGIQGGDIDGDGDRDILVNHWGVASRKWGRKGGMLGVMWLESIDREPWLLEHVVRTDGQKHGSALGDINGDGRVDIVTILGWYEQPQDAANAESWPFHADYEIPFAASHPFAAHDVDADGDCDLVAGSAHNAGLLWLEQRRESGGKRSFQEHWIDRQGNHWHTMTLADINADGKLDLVTGNKLFPHFGKDPGAFQPRGVYWFNFKGGTFERHVLSYNSMQWWPGEENLSPPPNAAITTSMQIVVQDMNQDGLVDIVLSGKTGLYLFQNSGEAPEAKHNLEWPKAERGYYYDRSE